ncbi:MAG: peptide chain release factor N(5)-glutamine methyltransferase [Candidatus Omnitrophota bacterium]|nr:peptide chain release factor N(5)-glutamine methyltransferase [Candidatus Omnitrophota bacterium]MDZ4242950.1 peptide chain release factor N(5)-glutamine methyltransferase [Candidatus Omnitrophota bacterium]
MTEQELILTSIRGCRRVDLYARPVPLSPEQEARFRGILARRQAGEPLQYLLGECEFMGSPFYVDSRVLIPRPETEHLAEWAIEKILLLGTTRQLEILDVGTGSGAIAVSLAKLCPGCHVTALDFSEAALDVARRNAERNQVSDRVEFVCADIFSWTPSGKIFDAVVSNPPYIPSAKIAFLPPDVRKEPVSALDGGPDGLRFYRRIVGACAEWLALDGFLMMEMGDGQRPEIERLLHSTASFVGLEFRRDLAGTDRIFAARRLSPTGQIP